MYLMDQRKILVAEEVRKIADNLRVGLTGKRILCRSSLNLPELRIKTLRNDKSFWSLYI